jgi:hypothetical protein
MLMDAIRARLAVGLLGAQVPALPEKFRAPVEREGILGLYWQSRKHAQVVAKGKDLEDLAAGLSVAMGRACSQSPRGRDAIENGVLKLDIITSRDVKAVRLSITVLPEESPDLGLWGVAVHDERARADGAADVAVHFSPLDVLLAASAPEPLSRMYQELGRTAPTRWKAEVLRAYSLVEGSPRGPAVRFYRTGPLFEDADGKDVRDAYLQCCRWLLNVQNAEGRFPVDYHPLTRQTSKEHRLRDHFATLEPLLRIYEATLDERMAEAIAKAFRHAEKQVVDAESPPPDEDVEARKPLLKGQPISYVVVKREGRPKGQSEDIATGTAMLLAAECRRAQVFRSGVSGLMRRLGRTLVLLTDRKDVMGRMGFTLTHLMRGESAYEPQTDAPGLSIYALCLLNEVDPDPAWLGTAKAIGRHRLAPDRTPESRTPWDVIGISRLYLATGAEEFCAGAHVLAAALLGGQEETYRLSDDYKDATMVRKERREKLHWPGRAPYLDYEGGFANAAPPDVISAAMRLRALTAAYKVAIVKEPAVLTFRQAVRDATLPMARFIIGRQYRQGNTFYLSNTQLIEGAFRNSVLDMEVRTGASAECIMALMDCMDVLSLGEVTLPPPGQGTTGGTGK